MSAEKGGNGGMGVDHDYCAGCNYDTYLRDPLVVNVDRYRKGRSDLTETDYFESFRRVCRYIGEKKQEVRGIVDSDGGPVRLTNLGVLHINARTLCENGQNQESLEESI